MLGEGGTAVHLIRGGKIKLKRYNVIARDSPLIQEALGLGMLGLRPIPLPTLPNPELEAAPGQVILLLYGQVPLS